jgi:hypothetical protein
VKRFIPILLLFICFFGYGQKNTDIEVPYSPKPIKPGQFFTVLFNLPDAESYPKGSYHKLILPENWKLIAEKKYNTADTFYTTKYFYTILTPTQTRAGSHPIEFQIIYKNMIIRLRQVFIRVEAVRKIEITPLIQPEFVKEGDVLRVEYLVQNLGNKTERVRLETSRGKVEKMRDSIDIEPNSYIKATVKQDIPYTESNSWWTSSDLKLSFSHQPIPVFKTLSIPVYSSKIKKSDPFLRFPITVGGGYLSYTLGDKTVSAYQYNADGRGYLDFSKKHYLDFILRGPNQFQFPTIGNYDQYSLAYSYLNKTHIAVGDYLLRFNNLMEFGRFGRGFKIEQTINKLNFTAFYQKTRFFLNQKDAFGGSIKLNFDGESYIGLNAMSKSLIEKNTPFRSNLVGISSFIKKKYFSNETEWTLGQSYDKLNFGLGFFNKMNVNYKGLVMNSEAIYAGKEFYGFYTNSRLLVNSVNYYLNKKLNIGVNSNITRVNPSLDVIKYAISPYSTTHLVFLSYQPNPKNQLFLNFTRQEREDRQQPSSFHFKEDFGNLSYNLSTQKFTLAAQSRYGFAENLRVLDSAGKKAAKGYLLQPAVALMPWFWVGGYLEYQHTSKFSSTNEFQKLYYYGGNMRLNYNKYISLSLMYRNNYAPDELYEKRSLLDASLILDYERHQLSVEAGRAYFPNLPNNEQNTLFLSARYTLKLNVPIDKDKKLGHLKGRISTLSEDIKKEGVLVQLGQYKVLSDADGHFTFPNLMPNKYSVTLSNESRIAGVVSTVKTPIEVNIKADSTEFLTIPLIKTGGIIGKIDFGEGGKEKRDPSVKPLIYIKLYNEKENFVTQMNDRNEFSFKEIKPGSWKLKTIIVGETQQFELLNQEQDVEIEAGKIKTTVFSGKTIERKIQFSGKSFHLSTEK